MTEQRSPIDNALDLLVYAPVGLALTAAEELPKLAAKGRAQVEGQISVARMLGQFAVAQGRKEIEKRLGGAPRPAPREGPATKPTQGGGTGGGASGPGASGAAKSRSAASRGARSAGNGFVGEEASFERLSGRPSGATTSDPGTSGATTSGPGTSGATTSGPTTSGPGTEPPETVASVETEASVIDVDFATGARSGPGAEGLAIPGYDSLSASQVVQRLAGLSQDELAAVGEYEAAHRGRRTILTRVGQLKG